MIVPVAEPQDVGLLLVRILAVGLRFTIIVCVVELEQPLASVYVYVIVCVPTPAILGLNTFPTTPAPENVPPTGVADKFLATSNEHISAFELVIVTVGKALTVIV